MAAALLAERLAAWPSPTVVESAGLAALTGSTADPLAVSLLLHRGLDISGHRARQLTQQLAGDFELILVMEEQHEKRVNAIFPSARGRVHRLGRFGGFDIPDPYRKPRAAFESSLALIERGIGDYVRAFWTPK